jgi:hypothetical protein
VSQEDEVKKARIQTPKDTYPFTEYLLYNPENGDLIWKQRPSYSVSMGDKAGALDRKGYIKIQLKGKQYYAHRIAFLLMGEDLGEDYVDHVDGNKSNNTWSNLRKASPQQNSFNSKIPSTNTSGAAGVCWDKKKNKWRVYCQHKHLGYFNGLEDARRKYEEVSREQYGEFKYEN